MVLLVRRLPTSRELRIGLWVGAVLAAGYLTQTAGLTMTSPGNAGLITGMFVVFTPVAHRVCGRRSRWWTWVATAVSLGGILFLTGGPTGMGVGDVLVLACAVLYALHIVLLGKWAPGLPAAPLAMVQMASCTLIFSAGGTWSLRMPSASVWWAIGITGIFAPLPVGGRAGQGAAEGAARPTPGWGTGSPDWGECRASRCCVRSVGTHSAGRPKTRL